MASSKSERSYTRAPMRVSSRQKTRNRFTGGGVAWIATTTRRPRTASRLKPDPAQRLHRTPRSHRHAGSLRPVRDQRVHVAARRIDGLQPEHLGERPPLLASSRTSTSAPAARATHATSRPIGPPPTTTAFSPCRRAARRTSCTATAVGSTNAPTSDGRSGRQRDEHSGGNDPARLHRPRRVDAEEVQVVADVRMARAASWAVAAPVQRHDGDLVADRPPGRPRPHRGDRP